MILSSSLLVVLLHGALTLAVALRVVMRRPARGVALAWLLLVVALPYVGAITYFMIGERRIGRGRAGRITKLREDYREIIGPRVQDLVAGRTHDHGIARLGESFFGLPPLPGNNLVLHANTQEVLKAIAADIDAARTSVLMEFYIWNEGGSADIVFDALIAAAKRGVTCLVLIDGLGASRWWRSGQPRALREAGVSLKAALPTGIFHSFIGRTDLRLHRKIVVIDGASSWTGSMNMVDPRYFKVDAGVGEWVDAMVRIEGPAASLLAAVMIGDWVAEGTDSVHDVIAAARLEGAAAQGDVAVQVAASGPGESFDGLLQLMLALVNAARCEIVMTTPYFVPDDALVLALRGAAARGVRVAVIQPEKIDSRLVRYASRSFFEDITAKGGEVHFYRGGLLHTKSITIDGEVSMFGTANLDMRSLWLNYEVTLLVYDREFTKGLRALQQDYLKNSVPLDLVAWAARPFRERLLESVLRLMSPLL